MKKRRMESNEERGKRKVPRQAGGDLKVRVYIADIQTLDVAIRPFGSLGSDGFGILILSNEEAYETPI